MKTSHRTLPVVLLVLWAGSLDAQIGMLRGAWTSPCTLSVVLVAFRDTNAAHPGRTTATDTIVADYFNYYDHDLPHDYEINAAGALAPGDSSYTMDDFRRLFSGGYDGVPAFTDTGQTVANGTEPLPEVFGSLRHYFHVVSNGAFELRVRILNIERDDYPVWVQLPQTKGYYAERFQNDAEYWNDAEMAIRDSIRAWNLDSTAYDPPTRRDPWTRRRGHKVLYLHSGPVFHDNRDVTLRNSLIHPRADPITSSRYVMGERHGSGGDSHRADRFSAIGLHAHEMGHLLGLWGHPGGYWIGTNRYTNQTSGPPPQGLDPPFNQARTLSWSVMQSGADGPPVEGSVENNAAWVYPYRSCPAPFTPLHRLQLGGGWISTVDIPVTTLNQPINPGRYYSFRDAEGSTYVLEFRTAEGFGRYATWYRFDEAPGLMIWKMRGARTLLIPADNRRVSNAKERTTGGNVPRTPRAFSSTFVYPWIDLLSDPFGAKDGNGLRATIASMAYYAVDEPRNRLPSSLSLTDSTLREPVTAADDGHFQHVGIYNEHGPAVNPRIENHPPSRRAIRNIRVTRNTATPATGSALVDIYFDHWVGPVDGMETWSGTVYVGGDVTVESGASLTIANNTTVHFLTPLADDANGRPDLIVSSGATLTVGRGVTFGTADRDGARTPALGLRVETGGTATLNGVTLAEGPRHHWSGTVTVGGDLTVADTLTVAVGSVVRFAAGDSTSGGQDPARSELTVQSSGRLIAPRATFQGVDASTRWYGIHVEAHGTAELSMAEVRDALHCVGGPGTVTRVGLSLKNCGVPPDAPENLEALPGFKQVTLGWTDPEDDRITGWEYRYRWTEEELFGEWTAMDDSLMTTIPGRESATIAYPVSGLTGGAEYVLQVRGVIGSIAGAWAQVEATPQATHPDPPNRAPVITAGPDSVTFAENGPDSVATYAATDADGDTLRWTRFGTDAADFEVRGDTLFFVAPPNYEAPTDRAPGQGLAGQDAGDNTYEVSLVVHDRAAGEEGLTDTVKVTVEVVNVNEAPQVTGRDSAGVLEGTTRVGLYEATDPDVGQTDSLEWALSGPDSSLFELRDLDAFVASERELRELHYRSAPVFREGTDTVRVVVEDPGGLKDGVEVTVTLVRVAVSGPADTSLAENGPTRVGTYTGVGVDTLFLEGVQADSLELRPLSPPVATKRDLYFRNVPNYEDTSRYEVQVIGRNKAAMVDDTLEVVVTVLDRNDPGVVTLANMRPGWRS